MANYVVCMEPDRATVLKIGVVENTPKITERHEVKSRSGAGASETLFRDTARALSDAKEVLLLGPSPTRDRFEDHLIRHHNSIVTTTVMGKDAEPQPNEIQLQNLLQFFVRNVRPALKSVALKWGT